MATKRSEKMNAFYAQSGGVTAVINASASGADPTLVGRALTLSMAGGLALGQSPENCFDPATSNALVARGGEALSLAKLPLKLLARWPA